MIAIVARDAYSVERPCHPVRGRGSVLGRSRVQRSGFERPGGVHQQVNAAIGTDKQGEVGAVRAVVRASHIENPPGVVEEGVHYGSYRPTDRNFEPACELFAAPDRLTSVINVNRELWSEYRSTWDIFSRRLDEQQKFAEAGDPDRLRQATKAVEDARLAHNAARDRLAAELTSGIPETDRVRKTARVLWEFAGQPPGTAETDWLHAEKVVRAARAAAR